MPVIQPDPLTTTIFRGETDTQKKLQLPSKYLQDSPPKVKIALSDSYLVQFSSDVDELISYPHGCAEQTSSKILAMHNIEPFIKGASKTHQTQLLESKKSFIEQGIHKLATMQNSNGSFSYWNGGGYVNNFASIYACDVLLDIKTSKISSRMLSGIESYLTREVKYEKHPFNKMYAGYLLSKFNKLPDSMVNILYDNKWYEKNLVTLYMMAVIAKNANQSAMVETLFKVIDKNVSNGASTPRSYGDSFNSDIRNNAFALYLHVSNFEKNAISEKLLETMSRQMNDMYSTQDKAFVMRALLSYYGKNNKKIDAVLELNGESIPIKNATTINTELKKDTIQITSNNSSIVNYNVEVSQYLPQPLHHSSIIGKSGLSIYRSYVDEYGHKINLDNIQIGETIYSKIMLSANEAYENIVIADRTPACFEIVNKRTSKNARPNNIQDKNFAPQYQDIRDDRVLTYLDGKEDKIIFYTPLRVVSKGIYALPAVVAEVMYDPRINDYDKETEFIRVND
jgi:uncharacterized protein YfaS (alpha-2-macroglobulin family)